MDSRTDLGKKIFVGASSMSTIDDLRSHPPMVARGFQAAARRV